MADAVVNHVPNEKKRKRPRAARACELCRAKKYRCDEMYPCSHCKRQKVECHYDVPDHVRQRMVQMQARHTQDNTLQTQTGSEGILATPTTTTISTVAHNKPVPLPDTTATKLANTPSTQSHSPASSNWTQINTYRSQSTQNSQARGSVAAEPQATDDQDVEISDVNAHTQNVEFHGKTSSIAFLAALQPQNIQSTNGASPVNQQNQAPQSSLISILHNEAFSPETLVNNHHENHILEHDRYYFRQAQIFLEGFFQNIHFIHPILDRQSFMSRCEDLWFGKANRQPKSFIALYYSVLSLGALIKTWDEEKLDGLGRLEWSRKLFQLTRTAVSNISSMTAIESVQCLFFMAKVCQNELNPSLAYLYLGWAIRTSCSAGFNRRQPPPAAGSVDRADEIARLWWGLYSLEIEISFALGRPDSLGADAYHNQIVPASEDTEIIILAVMIPFAKIIKEVSLSIYLSEGTLHEKSSRALDIEVMMDSWLRDLPVTIRPAVFEATKTLKIMKAPTWAKRQRLVLELRFYNVKMVLFRPFLLIAIRYQHDLPTEVQEATRKCVDAAKSTIEIMHDMYCEHAFFRTWWYNTTYIVYAASIILAYGTRVAQRDEKASCLDLGQKAVEILESMEESLVAKNAAVTIRQILTSANEPPTEDANTANGNLESMGRQKLNDASLPQINDLPEDSFLSFLNLDENLDFLGMTFPLNSSHFPFFHDNNETLI